MRPEMQYTQNEISFCYEKNVITLLFITGEMKYNFVSRVVGVNRTIKICKQTIEAIMLEHGWR